MDHSAPITLNANQGTRRAIKRCPPTRAVAKPSKPKLAPRSQNAKVAPRPPTRYDASVCHRDGSGIGVPTASHTSQAPISTTHDANSASAALHASPCAALRPRSSLSTYIFIRPHCGRTVYSYTTTAVPRSINIYFFTTALRTNGIQLHDTTTAVPRISREQL